jgi:hypothetical protein
MFSFFKRKPKERSCVNCKYFKKGKVPSCTKTTFGYLKTFPFKNTKCQKYKER